MTLRLQRLLALATTALTAVTAGCGLMPGNASLGAHQLATAKALATDAYSTHRLVVSYKSGDTSLTKSALTQLGLRSVQDVPQLDLGVFALPNTASRTNLLAAIAAQPGVAAVEADAMVKGSYLPSDPQSSIGRDSNQYSSFRTEMRNAWGITRGDPGVVIAVIDTGVDLTHPELAEQVVPGKNFVTTAEVSDPETGATSLVNVPDKGPQDDNGHGTHVSGIIAAAENDHGITGVAPLCKIMPVKVLAYNESGFSSDVASGVVWAVDHGARVLNMSLGAYGGSKALEKAVAYAQSKGAVVVAAMGNDRDNPDKNFGVSPSYPAALPGVIAVAASDGQDQITYFSNAGAWVSVAAPGDGIYSTTPTYPTQGHVSLDYDEMSGTSMATPFVSGTVALMLSFYPQLGRNAQTPGLIKARLQDTADKLSSNKLSTSSGYGRINPFRALGGS